MIQKAELVVGIGLGPVDLDRAGGLAAGGVANVRRDAPVLSLELLDRVERRVAGEEGNGRVQSSAGEQQQRTCRFRVCPAAERICAARPPLPLPRRPPPVWCVWSNP